MSICIETTYIKIIDLYFNIAGVTHVGGDMFESVPDGDVIFLKVGLYII
jgi:hypothetical protein